MHPMEETNQGEMENRRVTRNRMELNYVKSNSGNKYARQPNTQMEGKKKESRDSEEETAAKAAG